MTSKPLRPAGEEARPVGIGNGLLRVVTAVVGIPVVIGAVYLGGWAFVGLLLLGALVSQHELYALLRSNNVRPLVLPGLLIGGIIGVRALTPVAVPAAIALAVALSVFVLLSKRFEDPWQSLSATLTGIFYPTVLLTYLIDLRMDSAARLGEEGAFWLTIAVFVLVWVSDTAAYYVGKMVGRRPLAPAISPKKTWEGSIGGAAGAIVAALLLWQLELVALGGFDIVVLGLICGSLGQLGDLAESRLKRVSGVKDSGTILPGHGGLLDRLDAMIVAVPMAYLYLAVVRGVI